MPRYSSIQERFWSKVNKNGPIPEYAPHLGRCWLWTAYRHANGYGQFRDGQRHVYAHRWAYGLIPEELECDHLCRVRHCVRRSHLEAVTHYENIQRGNGHGKETHCPQKHPYNEANTYVSPQGKRFCRECSRESCRARRAKLQLVGGTA